jgi:hypothetical protein
MWPLTAKIAAEVCAFLRPPPHEFNSEVSFRAAALFYSRYSIIASWDRLLLHDDGASPERLSRYSEIVKAIMVPGKVVGVAIGTGRSPVSHYL